MSDAKDVRVFYRRAFSVVAAFLFVLAVWELSGIPAQGMGLGYLFLFASAIIIVRAGISASMSKRARWLSLCYGSVFALALAVGNVVYGDGPLRDALHSGSGALKWILAVFGIAAIVTSLVILLFRKIDLLTFSDGMDKAVFKFSRISPSKILLVSWVLIFAAWIPCYLAYYPGVFSYDISSQMRQVAVGSWSSHQPPVHSLIWALCFWIGGEGGLFEPIVIYSLGQMIFLSFCCAWTVRSMASWRFSKIAIMLSCLFFALDPAISLFSFSTTKDAMFGGFFLLLLTAFVTCVMRIEERRTPWPNMLSLGLFSLACCLLRNNFVYALVVFVVVLFCMGFYVRMRRNEMRILRLIPALALPIVLAFLIAGPLYDGLGIRKGPERESQSVMIEQISKVAFNHEDELSDEDIMRIEEFVPVQVIRDEFNPRFADHVKNHFQSDGKSAALFALWLDLGIRYPKEYVVEFLDLNIPYWYPCASSCDPFSKVKYIEENVVQKEYYAFERESKLPWLLSFYEGIADGSSFEGKPLLSAFFSLSAPLWVMLLCLCYAFYRQRWEAVALVLLPLLFWGTYLLGPVSNFRYIFPLVLVLPLLIIYSMCPNPRETRLKNSLSLERLTSVSSEKCHCYEHCKTLDAR